MTKFLTNKTSQFKYLGVGKTSCCQKYSRFDQIQEVNLLFGYSFNAYWHHHQALNDQCDCWPRTSVIWCRAYSVRSKDVMPHMQEKQNKLQLNEWDNIANLAQVIPMPQLLTHILTAVDIPSKRKMLKSQIKNITGSSGRWRQQALKLQPYSKFTSSI